MHAEGRVLGLAGLGSSPEQSGHPCHPEGSPRGTPHFLTCPLSLALREPLLSRKPLRSPACSQALHI